MTILIKKGHRYLVTFFSMALAFFLSFLGRQQPSQAEELKEVRLSQQTPPPVTAITGSPSAGTKSPAPPAFEVHSNIPPIETYTVPGTEDPIGSNVESFLKSSIALPSQQILEADKLYTENPALYRLMIEGLQVQLLLINQQTELKERIRTLEEELKKLQAE
ncbi:MAG: hypothetical protein HY541_08665 [Deltaproteobacteria bacterium]|nr:hypothetical protein [Deltaproteobacteria bacterium]